MKKIETYQIYCCEFEYDSTEEDRKLLNLFF